MDLKQLAEPFLATDIEWRVGQAGMKGDAPWAKVLAYVTNRAIMQRLDDVCGPANWRNEYRYEQAGAVLCGISVRVNVGAVAGLAGEWVTKWDGAENTDIEAVKGGLSNAMKRAAVQWGIGRYLYDLEEGWAEIGPSGSHYVPKNDKKGMPAFRWNPPKLPSWAQPGFNGTTPTPAKVEKPKRDVLAGGVEKAKAVEVRGKTLDNHTTDELAVMEARLRSEGGTKHRDLLGSITLVLSARPADDVKVARMNAGEEQHQAGLEPLMAGKA